MKQAQSIFGSKPARTRLPKDPLVEVFRAIEKGHKTREQIQRSTRLTYDEVGQQLVDLVWTYGAVKLEERQFTLRDTEPKAAQFFSLGTKGRAA